MDAPCFNWNLDIFSFDAGAFLFGAYHHYVMVSPDNIHHLPTASAEAGYQFTISAGVIALIELASALYGAFCLGSRGRPIADI